MGGPTIQTLAIDLEPGTFTCVCDVHPQQMKGRLTAQRHNGPGSRAPGAARVALEHVTRIFPGGTRAVSNLDLEVHDGELMVLVGPSGSGKTTALRIVAGLEEVTSGTVRIGGRAVNDMAPKDRDVAMVFQTYALYPHLTVAENIGFGLKLRKASKQEIRQRVEEAARLLGLEGLLDRRPRQLSGGQRQRVAMGRAIVREPQVFLMDEPLSNLDAKLRVKMRVEIARIQRRLGVSTIYVTHDQIEAMTLGDRVAVMRKGLLQQVDEPHVLYERPVNIFVGGFIGSPSMNLVEATVENGGDGVVQVTVGSQRLRVDDELAHRLGLARHAGRRLALGIRPEDMENATVASEHPADRRLRSTVDLVEALGAEMYVHFTVDAPSVISEHTVDLAADVGDEAVEVLHKQAAHAQAEVVARFDARAAVRPSGPLEVAVDTSRLHFFDPDTGLAFEGQRA